MSVTEDMIITFKYETVDLICLIYLLLINITFNLLSANTKYREGLELNKTHKVLREG